MGETEEKPDEIRPEDGLTRPGGDPGAPGGPEPGTPGPEPAPEPELSEPVPQEEPAPQAEPAQTADSAPPEEPAFHVEQPLPAGPESGDAPLKFAQEESDRPGQSYWSIVTTQFRRNRLAVWSMRVLILMFLLAVYAPLISHNVPFFLKDNLRSTLGAGDVVAVGAHRFKVEYASEAAPPAEGAGRDAASAARFRVVDESGAGHPIVGELTVGSGEKCRIRRPGLEKTHAVFGLWGDGAWVEDVSGGRSIQVNGRPVGGMTWPWFYSLFDRNEYETDIDVVFNILVFYLPPSLMLFFGLRALMKRRHGWGAARTIAMIAIVGGLGGIYAFVKTHESKLPYRDWKAEIAASKGEKSGLFPLFPHSYRQQALNLNLLPPWRKAYFGVLGDVYKAEFRKTDRISVAGETFTISYKAVGAAADGLPPKAMHFLRDSMDREFPLEGRVLLGTGPGCTVTLTSPDAKEVHAAVEAADGKFFLEDLTGTGTALVNNIPVNGVMETLFSRLYVFGADQLGRSVFSRLLYGTRISLTIGIVAVSIYVTIGILIGGIAGYFGGLVDILVSRIIEIIICFPTFFLILSLVAMLGKNIFYVMLIIGITHWTGVARLIRGEFLKQKQIDYVTAARALGVSRFRIMFKHILPNAIAPVLVSASFGVAGAILLESGLSFLGLGDVRTPSWGQILDAGRASKEHHLIHLPGLAIFVTVAIMNLMGEGLRDALDPKLRK